MACPYGIEEHSVFRLLKAEHTQIRNRISQANTAQEQRSLLDWLWREVEGRLHSQEETLLYPLVAANPRLAEGGPYCTHYFDQHLNNSPSQKAKSLTGSEAGWEERQRSFCDLQSPILIPLEEHRSLKHILRYLIETQLSDADFLLAFEIYRSLLYLHLTKEERCFFRVCQSLIAKPELDELQRRWSPLSD